MVPCRLPNPSHLRAGGGEPSTASLAEVETYLSDLLVRNLGESNIKHLQTHANNGCGPPTHAAGSVIVGWPVRHDGPPKPHPRAGLTLGAFVPALRILGLIIQRDTFAELVPAHDGANPVNFERAPLKMPPRSAYLFVLVRMQVPSH